VLNLLFVALFEGSSAFWANEHSSAKALFLVHKAYMIQGRTPSAQSRQRAHKTAHERTYKKHPFESF